MAYSVDGLSVGDTLSVEDLKQKNELIWANSVRAIQTGGTAPDGNPEVMIIEAAAGGGGSGGDVTLAEVIVRDTQTLNAAKAYTDAKPGITVVDDLPVTIAPDTIIAVTSGNLPPTGGGGRKSATLVVGTVLMGHTEADVDILLTGVNDHVLLQQGLDALPSTGGEIVVLEGTYNFGGGVTISKSNVTIRGMGFSTGFKRMWNDTEGNGMFSITGSHCTLSSFDLNGNRAAYNATINHGIRLTGGQFARLVGLHIHDTQSAIWGSVGDINVLDCIIDGTNTRGLYMNAGGCLIRGNTIKNATTAINFYSALAVDNVLIGNILLNNSTGILLSAGAARNAVTGNHVKRGTGLAGDYTTDQYTIRLTDAATANNLITNNMIFGKDVADAGTGNTLDKNKFS